jgi:hypothetical protein
VKNMEPQKHGNTEGVWTGCRALAEPSRKIFRILRSEVAGGHGYAAGRSVEPPTRPAIPVQVTDVVVDRGGPCDKHLSYEITLSCGCHWCEERSQSDRAPEVGAVAYCATKHSRANLC